MDRLVTCFALFMALLAISEGLYFHIAETEKKCFIEEIPDETMVVGNYKVEMFDKIQNHYVPTMTGLGMHVEVRDSEDKMIMSRIWLDYCIWDNISFPSVGWLVSGNYKVQIFDYQINDYLPTTSGLGMHVDVRDPDDKTIISRTYAAEGRFTFTSHTAGEHTICLLSNSTAWFGGGQLRVHLDIQVGEHANDYQQIAAKDKLTELQLRVRQLLDQVEQITKEQNYQRYREERFRQTSESTNQRVLWWSIAQTIILLITGFWQMRHLKGFFEAKKLV